MQVIGICRFSYPAVGGFQVSFPTLEEQLVHLYAPARMEQRLRTFETITLPALRGQTDDDFILLVVIGDSLPAPYRDRLTALLADVPQAVVQVHPPRRHRRVMREAINSVRQFDGISSLQFRMDDDDAVAVTFVERLRQTARDIGGLGSRYAYVGIDFNQGYIARPDVDGLHAAQSQVPYVTAGLGMMIHPDETRCVMNFSHNTLVRTMPTVTFADEVMYLRGHNDFNDSRQRPGIKPVPLDLVPREDEPLFKATFNVDANHIRSVFSRP